MQSLSRSGGILATSAYVLTTLAAVTTLAATDVRAAPFADNHVGRYVGVASQARADVGFAAPLAILAIGTPVSCNT